MGASDGEDADVDVALGSDEALGLGERLAEDDGEGDGLGEDSGLGDGDPPPPSDGLLTGEGDSVGDGLLLEAESGELEAAVAA